MTATLSPKRSAALALLLLVPVPTLSVLAAAQFRPGILGPALYGLGKVWILALPVIWLLMVDRGRLSLSPPKRGGLRVGIALGVGISVIILITHALLGGRLLDPDLIRQAAERNQISSPVIYLALCTYLTLANSLLEEYVWRWFVFRKCEILWGRWPAVFASALFFTLHHVVALKLQMDWGATLLCSAGVFIGGAVWSWCYLSFRSIWPGFASHAVVDAAIFWLGWRLIFGG